MTLPSEKYLTAIVVIIVYIKEVSALIATLCILRGQIVRKKAGINCFYKVLHIATVATATIIIRDTNDVVGVWDRVLQLYQA